MDLVEKNHLERLPPELLHHIFSYLFCDHNPNFAHRPPAFLRCAPRRPALPHPLDALAATSNHLRAEVNEWALHFFLEHRTITKHQSLIPAATTAPMSRLRGPKGLLTWAERHCAFYGRKTTCRAPFMSSLRCCRACDDVHWPSRITKTDAKKLFHLHEDELFSRLIACGAMPPSGVIRQPKPRWGTYMRVGVVATVFLREEVAALQASKQETRARGVQNLQLNPPGAKWDGIQPDRG